VRGASGREALHPPGGVVTQLPGVAAVDDDADPLDGEAGLGDVGGQNHFAASFGGREEGSALLSGAQVAIEGRERHIGSQSGSQESFAAADLRCTGEKGQYGALLFIQRFQDRLGERLGKLPRRRKRGVRRQMTQAYFVAASRTLDDGSLGPQNFPQGVDLQGRGHRQQTQILAEELPALEGQSQTQVAGEGTLVHFVEDHQPHILQSGIAAEPPHQQPFGDHLDPGPGSAADFPAHPIAHPLSRRLFQAFGHPGRHHPSRQPSGFEEEDLLPRQPGFLHQLQRHDGAFARARIGPEDRRAMSKKRGF